MVVNRDRTGRMELDKTLQLKLMLRDQKKEMSAIKGNPLFKELMRKPGGRQVRTADDAKRRVGPEDTDAEGKIRMLRAIQDAAQHGAKDQRGVWSSFGKAYVSMGQFEDLKPSLPRLWRDKMEAEAESQRALQMKPQRSAHISNDPLHEERSSSTVGVVDEQEDERLWKNLMMVTTRDFKEASFPKTPLKLADARRRMHSSSATRFVNPTESATQAADPKQWGSWCYDRPGGSRSGELAPLSPAASELSRFAPPATAATAPPPQPSLLPQEPFSPNVRESSAEGPKAGDVLALPTPPAWDPPMVKFLRPLPREETRVEDWRASFIETRQQLRARLQEDLWRRTQARGHAKYFMEHGARKGQSRKRPTAGPVDMEEIELLERFYNQLCLLVERQRVSDPASVALLLCVKELLEKGLTLSRHLMAAVVEGLAHWANHSGMQAHNLCVLPILTFIRKCVGVDVEDMQKLVFNYSLGGLVYGSQADAVHADLKASAASAPGGAGAGAGARKPSNALRRGSGNSSFKGAPRAGGRSR
eukprot:jgi/Tetstr1/460631/TSEL_005828.t1